MTQYRNDLDAARARIETLEAKIREREAALDARDAELAELRGELERARRGQAEMFSTAAYDAPPGGHRALLVALAACTFLTAAAYAMVRPTRCSGARWRQPAPTQVYIQRAPTVDVGQTKGVPGGMGTRDKERARAVEQSASPR
ncbi:MAG TPA: hypothetical protein VLS89_14015 [Candidatus Nanopelagicales bacterium]|nr:hypothetical protein [Candidatus Nanopelagicales bacterium]